MNLTKGTSGLIMVQPEGGVLSSGRGTVIPYSNSGEEVSALKVTIKKEDGGTFTVRTQPTTRDEVRVMPEQKVPRDQVSAAIETLVKKTRGEVP